MATVSSVSLSSAPNIFFLSYFGPNHLYEKDPSDMTTTKAQIEEPARRLILLLPGSHRLVAEKSRDLRLPRVDRRVLPWPPQLRANIEERWGLKSVILDVMNSAPPRDPCVFAEVRTQEREFEIEGLQAVSLECIPATELTQDEKHLISQMLIGDPGNRGPFSRAGWIDDALTWVRTEIGPPCVEFTNDIYQFRASGSYALVRFCTHAGNAFWLKATGERHAQELAVTVHLANQYPQYLPRLIAARKDWNAWVTEDVGSPLSTSISLRTVAGAISRYAELQKETIGKSDSLLRVGCFDQRIDVVLNHLWEIIEYLDEMYRLENTTKYPPISNVRLHQLGHLLEEACHQMKACQIPDTLIWGDMNPGNILLDGSSYLFIDWAETYVGNPFLNFRLDAIKLLQGNYQKWIDQLTLTYKNCWREHVSDEKLEEAFGLVPFLGLLSWLYRRGTWLNFPKRNDREFHDHCRMIAHQINESACNVQLHRLNYR